MTFFFKNFPEPIDSAILEKRFNEIAMVAYIFVPKRKDNRGVRFGFVRFGKDINSWKVEKRLNEIWFGSYKLVANLPKFARNGTDKRPDSNQRNGQAKELSTHIIVQNEVRRDNTSFADVVSQKTSSFSAEQRMTGEKGDFNGLKYESEESERRWLKECYIGILKEKVRWIEDGEEIRRECKNRLSTHYIKGDLVLIQSICGGKIDDEIVKWKE